MTGIHLLQEQRRMGFEEAHGGWQAMRLTQEEAAPRRAERSRQWALEVQQRRGTNVATVALHGYC